MHNSWETVIATLAAINMVVGVDQFVPQLSPKQLAGSVRNHLICVHVGLST